jgi:hypothetical protein
MGELRGGEKGREGDVVCEGVEVKRRSTLFDSLPPATLLAKHMSLIGRGPKAGIQRKLKTG